MDAKFEAKVKDFIQKVCEGKKIGIEPEIVFQKVNSFTAVTLWGIPVMNFQNPDSGVLENSHKDIFMAWFGKYAGPEVFSLVSDMETAAHRRGVFGKPYFTNSGMSQKVTIGITEYAIFVPFDSKLKPYIVGKGKVNA